MHHPTDRIAHTTTFVTPVVEHWLEREIAQWVHPMKDRSDDPPHHERTLHLSYVPLPLSYECKNGQCCETCIVARNILFNFTFNPFYFYGLVMSDMRLRTIRIIDMGNPVPPLHGLFFSISSKRSCFSFPLFVELQLESDMDQCIRQEGSIQ